MEVTKRIPVVLALAMPVIASASWIFLLIFIVQLVSISIVAVREERSCLKMYGESYRKYMNKTPRWVGIPR